MARQQVDIGVEGNDGTGDSIRESFRKTNENFQEIYAVVGKGGQITFTLLADTPDSLTPFKGDGVDAYLPIVSQDGTSIEVRKLGSDSDENPANIDTISVNVSEAGKLILKLNAISVQSDPKPVLGGPLNAAGVAIANVGTSTTDANNFNNVHGTSFTTDDLVIDKKFADRNYIRRQDPGETINVPAEPTDAISFTKNIDGIQDIVGAQGVVLVPAHGLTRGSDGAAYIFNTSGTGLNWSRKDPTSGNTIASTDTDDNNQLIYSPLQNGDTVYIGVLDSNNLGFFVSKNDALLEDTTLRNDRRYNLTTTDAAALSITDAGYDTDIEGFFLSHQVLPRDAITRRQGDTMEGPLTLHDHPGDLAGAGTPNGLADLQAVSKLYVDSQSTESSANIFVSAVGDDDQDVAPPGKEGSSLAYSYRTIGAAARKAQAVQIASPFEPGPYMQDIFTSRLVTEGEPAVVELSQVTQTGFAVGAGLGSRANTKSLVASNLNYIIAEVVAWKDAQIAAKATTTVGTTNVVWTNRVVNDRALELDLRKGLTAALLDHVAGTLAQNLSVRVGVEFYNDEYGRSQNGLLKNVYAHLLERARTVTASVIVNTPFTSLQTIYTQDIITYGANQPDSDDSGSVTSNMTVQRDIVTGGVFSAPTERAGSRYELFFSNTVNGITQGKVDQGDPANRDLRVGKVIRGKTSGAIGKIIRYFPGDDNVNNPGSTDDLGELQLLSAQEFTIGEQLEMGNIVNNRQITVKIETGQYLEDYPIKVPANVSLVGDEFRRVIIRPKPQVSQSPWSGTYFYRDKGFDGLTGDSDSITGVADPGLPTAGEAYINPLSGATDGYFGRHYLYNPAIPKNVDNGGNLTITNPGGYLDAAVLIEKNKQFIIEENIAFITFAEDANASGTPGYDGYASLDWNAGAKDRYRRTIGSLVDAIAADLREGKSINVLHTQGAIFFDGLNYTNEAIPRFQSIIAASDVIQNIVVNTPYNNSLYTAFKGANHPTQYINANLAGGATVAGNGNLIYNIFELIKWGNDSTPNDDWNPAKRSNQLDAFLMNDATILRNMTVQGHGGFMCVLDPDGQILTKSPYIQTGSSFSQSINRQAFRGGMLVDAFCANTPVKVTSVEANGYELLITAEPGSGLAIRKPQTPCPFYINGIRYQVNDVTDYNDGGLGGSVAPTARLILDSTSGPKSEVDPSVNIGWDTVELPILAGGFALTLQTAGNRSQLGNDFTQVNDLGYGLVTINGGLSEMVSMFTYYCHTAYYAGNGGQIRSLNGSNANGLYGLVAEGSDPNEVPDDVVLKDDMTQSAKTFSAVTVIELSQNVTVAAGDTIANAASSASASGVSVFASVGKKIYLSGTSGSWSNGASVFINTVDSGADVTIVDTTGYTNLDDQLSLHVYDLEHIPSNKGELDYYHDDGGTPLNRIARYELANIQKMNGILVDGYTIDNTEYTYTPAARTTNVNGIIGNNESEPVSETTEARIVISKANKNGGIYSVDIFGTESGDHYKIGDVFTVTGTQLGGTTPANNATVTVTEINRSTLNVDKGIQTGSIRRMSITGSINSIAGYTPDRDGQVYKLNFSTSSDSFDNDGLLDEIPINKPVDIRNNATHLFRDIESVGSLTIRPSTAVNFDDDPIDTYRSISFGVNNSAGNILEDDESLTGFDAGYDFVGLLVEDSYVATTGATLSVASSSTTLGNTQGDTTIAITLLTESKDIFRINNNFDTDAQYQNIPADDTGRDYTINYELPKVISWRGKKHIVYNYREVKIESGVHNVQSVFGVSNTYAVVDIKEVSETSLTLNEKASWLRQNFFNLAERQVIVRQVGNTSATGKVKVKQTNEQILDLYDWSGVAFNTTGALEISIDAGGSYTTMTDLATGLINIVPTVVEVKETNVTAVASGLSQPVTQSFGAGILLRAGLQDGAPAKITIQISTCRATGHDFLDIGTGSFNQTNYPNVILGFPAKEASQTNEVNERNKGRVFFVSTDQDGFFRVGRFFTVDQGTGTVTFAGSIALSNLDGIGFKRGVVVSEFSTDDGMTQNGSDIVPTQNAVRGYVNRRLGWDHNGLAVNNVIGGGAIARDGSISMTGNFNMASKRIINLAAPSQDSDAVNKAYVDTVVEQYNTIDGMRDVSLEKPASASASTDADFYKDQLMHRTGYRVIMIDSTAIANGPLTANGKLVQGGNTGEIYDIVSETDGVLGNVQRVVYKELTGTFTQASVHTEVYTKAPTTTTASAGTSATFNVGRGTGYSVAIATAGSGYSAAETFTVAGADLGGATPANNATINITSVDGSGTITAATITGTTGLVTQPTGTITSGPHHEMANATPASGSQIEMIGTRLADEYRVSYDIKDGSIVNADVSATAAIAQSKLNMNAASTRANATGIAQTDLGLASFDDGDFSVTNGWVTLKTGNIDLSDIVPIANMTALTNISGASASAAANPITQTGGNSSLVMTKADGKIRTTGLIVGSDDGYVILQPKTGAATTIQMLTPGGATVFEATGTSAITAEFSASIDIDASGANTQSTLQQNSTYNNEGRLSSDWIYTQFIEAANEKGTGSTGIALGAGTGKTSAGEVSILVKDSAATKAPFKFSATGVVPDVTTTYNIGSSALKYNTVYATVFDGKATSAQYADLAENYSADTEHEPGTVIVLGGTKEITTTTTKGDAKVIGVVSEKPAYLMNSALQGEFVTPVALTGRVPCKVLGRVVPGDMLVSSAIAGYAIVNNNPTIGTVIGKALQAKDSTDKGVIEIVVGKV